MLLFLLTYMIGIVLGFSVMHIYYGESFYNNHMINLNNPEVSELFKHNFTVNSYFMLGFLSLGITNFIMILLNGFSLGFGLYLVQSNELFYQIIIVITIYGFFEIGAFFISTFVTFHICRYIYIKYIKKDEITLESNKIFKLILISYIFILIGSLLESNFLLFVDVLRK